MRLVQQVKSQYTTRQQLTHTAYVFAQDELYGEQSDLYRKQPVTRAIRTRQPPKVISLVIRNLIKLSTLCLRSILGYSLSLYVGLTS